MQFIIVVRFIFSSNILQYCWQHMYFIVPFFSITFFSSYVENLSITVLINAVHSCFISNVPKGSCCSSKCLSCHFAS